MLNTRERLFKIGTYLITISLSATMVACASADSGDNHSSSEKGLSLNDLENTTEVASGHIDSFSWNLPREPNDLDPVTTQTQPEGIVVGNLCEGLVSQNQDLSIDLWMAESFEQQKELQWSFILKDELKFWDGSAVTVEDVVYSINRSVNSEKSWWSGYLESVKDVYPGTKENEIIIELQEADAMLIQTLATAAGAISKKESVEEFGSEYGNSIDTLMCTGPFVPTEWIKGESLTIEANELYWGENPLANEIQFEWISDEAGITRALESGQIDGTFSVPFSATSRLSQSNDGDLVYGDSSIQIMLTPTEKRGPLTEPAVRQSIFHALDRETIAQAILGNAALPGVSFTPPYWSEGSEELDVRYIGLESGRNLQKAQEYLEDSSHPNGFKMDLALPNGESYVRMGSAIAEMLAEIGIEVELHVLTSAENDELFFDQKLRESYDGFLAEPYTNITNPLQMMMFVTPGHVYNYGLYENEDFHALYKAAHAATHEEERQKYISEAIEILDADLPWIPVAYLPVRLWQGSAISGSRASFSYIHSPWALDVGER